MIWMMRNSRGKPDALLTFAVISVTAVLIKVLLNGVVFRSWNFGTIDGNLAGAILLPTVGAYTTKRVVGGKEDKTP